MEVQQMIGLAEMGGVAAAVLGAGVVGAVVTYRRLFAPRAGSVQPGDYYLDFSRRLEALNGRVELLEASIKHLPTTENLMALVESIHLVDRRLAKIEGFVMGKESMSD